MEGDAVFSGVRRVMMGMGMGARPRRGGDLPVDEVVVDLGGGKVWVLEHEGDVEVLGRELWECPLRRVSGQGLI